MADLLTELGWALKAPFQNREDRWGGQPQDPFVPPPGPTSMPLQEPQQAPQMAQPPPLSPVRQFVAQRAAQAAPPPQQEAPLVPEGYGVYENPPAPQEQQAPPQSGQPPQQAMPPGYGYFRQRYGWPEGARESLKAAQEEDWREARRAAGGASGNIATTLITGIPIDTAHNYANTGMATRHAIQRLVMEQDEPALTTAQAGSDSAVAQAAAFQAMMTPGHPAYRALVAGALKDDPSLAQYGITEDSPAWMLGQIYSQRKPMVEQQASKATADKAREETSILRIDNDPHNPAIPAAIASLRQINPQLASQLPPGVTMGQIAKVAGPALDIWKARTDLAMKQQTYALDIAKFNLDIIGKTGAPPGWRMARNPATNMPYRLLGESEKAQLAEASAAASVVTGIIDEMDGLVSKRGLTGLGANENMSRYMTLAGQLKLYAPKLWGQENEKYGKNFEMAMHDVLPTGKGNAWLIGESQEHVRTKLAAIRHMAKEGQAVRFKAMGMEPDYAGGLPPSAVREK